MKSLISLLREHSKSTRVKRSSTVIRPKTQDLSLFISDLDWVRTNEPTLSRIELDASAEIIRGVCQIINKPEADSFGDRKWRGWFCWENALLRVKEFPMENFAEVKKALTLKKEERNPWMLSERKFRELEEYLIYCSIQDIYGLEESNESNHWTLVKLLVAVIR